MGEINEIKELLKTTIEAMTNNIKFQQEMIMQLQNDNRLLRTQLNDFISQKTHSNNNLQEIFASNINNNISINQATKTHHHPHHNPLEAEMLNKFKRNKKRLIKNKIIDTIRSKILSIPEIKEIIVDQHKYCSKASFYRYIEELKRHDFILVNNNTVKIKPLVEVV